jgi:assimilatory nitrate reductase catalytic subunit
VNAALPPLVAADATAGEVKSTCPYCGVGCGVIIQTQGHAIVGVRGDPDHPANHGRLCTKGSTLHLTATTAVTQQTRVLQPQWRESRHAAWQPLMWDTALDLAAQRFAATVAQHGPDSVGFYISGQLLTEDYYVFNKLAKGLIGTNNVDTNSRLCMSSAVAGYKQTLGADAPPACYDDVDHADCLFFAGSNAAWAHPVLFRRIEQARAQRPHMKVVVVDPRRTDTTDMADLHLQIQPGTDVMLFNGMLHLMLWEGWTDLIFIADHTHGFDAIKELVRDATPDTVARVCGVSKADLLTATRWFAGMGTSLDPMGSRGRTLSLYCQGLNQSTSGTAKNTALINLHLATGQIGKPGAAPFSLTGQPNAMGGREVGGLANLLSAHRDMANPAHRAEVAALWGLPDVPATPGKSAVEMFEAAADGAIRALWIACTNPAHSMPDVATVRRALQRAELVVLQDAFATTATAEFAHLLLPATTWGEKIGTVTNSERRISRVRPAVPAPGQARHDWAIATDFAQRLEAHLRPGRPSLFPYSLLDEHSGAQSIWLEHRESTRGRDLDITGLSWAMLDAAPQQWPLPEGQTRGRARLYADGVFPTADGRAKFVANAYQPVADARESRYPFALTTGRLRDQWHGMSRTGTLGRLFGHVAEPCVHMHPQDMVRRGLAEGDLAHVTSKRGSIVVPVVADTGLGLAQAFMAMHWGPEFLSGVSATGEALGGVNALTTSAYCPSSKQPELKHAAVKILKAQLPWTLVAAAWLPAAQALSVREQLRTHMQRYPFASSVPFADGTPLDRATGDEPVGLLFRAAAHEAPPAAWLDELEALVQLQGSDTLRYADAKRGQRRAVRLVRGSAGQARATLRGFLLAGDTQARGWIEALLKSQAEAADYGRLLLAPTAKPPAALATAAVADVVCSCFGVSADAITAALGRCGGTPVERLGQLQGELKCGTNCGSCLPELKRMVRQSAAPATVAVG